MHKRVRRLAYLMQHEFEYIDFILPLRFRPLIHPLCRLPDRYGGLLRLGDKLDLRVVRFCDENRMPLLAR
jgi:hypothetical protein